MHGLQQLAFQSGLLTAGLRVIMIQSHVTSDTRPSHFSGCNIEKLGMGLGILCALHSLVISTDLLPKIVKSSIRTEPLKIYGCPGQNISLFCQDPNSSTLKWKSDGYIGSNGELVSLASIFSQGFWRVHTLTENNITTVVNATLTKNNCSNGPGRCFLESVLNITIRGDLMNSTVSCFSDDGVGTIIVITKGKYTRYNSLCMYGVTHYHL